MTFIREEKVTKEKSKSKSKSKNEQIEIPKLGVLDSPVGVFFIYFFFSSFFSIS